MASSSRRWTRRSRRAGVRRRGHPSDFWLLLFWGPHERGSQRAGEPVTIGDVARVTLNGKLINDDFYNGLPLEIGLRRYAPDILNGELQLAVLPLRQDAPIYLPAEVRSLHDTQGGLAALKSIAVFPRHQVELISK